MAVIYSCDPSAVVPGGNYENCPEQDLNRNPFDSEGTLGPCRREFYGLGGFVLQRNATTAAPLGPKIANICVKLVYKAAY